MTGDPMQSKITKAHEKFSPYPTGYHKRGGGAVIPWYYEIEVKPKKLGDVFDTLNQIIEESGMPERFIKV